MTPLLPAFETEEAFDGYSHSDGDYREAVREICRKHNLRDASLRMIPEGESCIAYCVGDSLVLKMCPPLWPEKIDIEKEALYRASEVQVPVAKVEGAGELEGWKYLVMQRLLGQALDRCWQDIPHRQKEVLVQQIGTTVRTLHSACAPHRGTHPFSGDGTTRAPE